MARARIPDQTREPRPTDLCFSCLKGDALKNFKQEFFFSSEFKVLSHKSGTIFVEFSRCRSSSSKLKFFPNLNLSFFDFSRVLFHFDSDFDNRSRELEYETMLCCTEETLLAANENSMRSYDRREKGESKLFASDIYIYKHVRGEWNIRKVFQQIFLESIVFETFPS